LDPTGFAGYIFMKSEILLGAIDNPDRFLRSIQRSGLAKLETRQLSLFTEEKEIR
jgi:hypothetical protein